MHIKRTYYGFREENSQRVIKLSDFFVGDIVGYSQLYYDINFIMIYKCVHNYIRERDKC